MVIETEKIKSYREIEGGRLRLNFHIGQAKAWDSKARFVGLIGGTQLGKTCFAPDWLEREIRERGPGDYLAVTATFPLLNLKLLPEFRYVFESLYHVARYKEVHGSRFLVFHKEKKKSDDVVLFSEGEYEKAGVQETRIVFGSATNPESLESATAKAAVLDECVAPETLIQTEIGSLPISEIVDLQLPIRVWSFDTGSETWELKPIVRWKKLPQSKPFLKLGNLRLTGNHKVWTNRGYIRADGLITSAQFTILEVEVIRGGEFTFGRDQAGVVYSEWMDVSSFLKSYGGDLGGGLSQDGYVYNLEVEGNHNFVANGILVSNCGQKQFRRDSWEATLRRLSLARGRCLLITTLYGFGWLKDEVYDPWANGNPDFDIIQVDSIVNPAFPRDEWERAKRTLPPWKFDLFYRGQFAKPAGLIYDSFDSPVSVIDPFEIPENWPVYVGHDFGSNNMASLWFAQDPTTGYFYCFDEYLQGGKATFEHVNEWLEMAKGHRIAKRVGGSHQEVGWRNDFSQAGWAINEPTELRVDEGIQKVYGFFKTGKLFIFRRCQNFIDELESYSYELDEKYQPTEKIENKERYHLCDCARYILADFNPVQREACEVSMYVGGRRIY